MYPNTPDEYASHSKPDLDKAAIVFYYKNEPFACGCFKEFSQNTVEPKRMYVHYKLRRHRYFQKSY